MLHTYTHILHGVIHKNITSLFALRMSVKSQRIDSFGFFPCVCQKINTTQFERINCVFYDVAFIWWAITFINNIYSMMYFMLNMKIRFCFNSIHSFVRYLFWCIVLDSFSDTGYRTCREKNEIKLIVHGLCHMICIKSSKSKWKWLRNKCLYFHSWTLAVTHRHPIDLDWWLQMAMKANRKVLCWMISPNYSCKPSNAGHKHNQIKTTYDKFIIRSVSPSLLLLFYHE